MDKTITAKLNRLNVAPRKTRFLADTVRGLSVSEAEAQLMLGARRPSVPLLKLLRSAVANAKNQQVPTEKLYVKEIRVDKGRTQKRYMPRAFGRVNLIEKKTSHVTLVLGVSDKLKEPRFTVAPKPKKEKKEKPKKPAGESKEPEKKKPAPEVKKVEEKPGFFRKVFRRKSV
ncbi:MAG: 50S ribosomal protein L22 [Candidatus Brennerbacteria bacterium]|nr:50S ribosomal protein L22 [Candidatus Brennerbacteria bacterium]